MWATLMNRSALVPSAKRLPSANVTPHTSPNVMCTASEEDRLSVPSLGCVLRLRPSLSPRLLELFQKALSYRPGGPRSYEGLKQCSKARQMKKSQEESDVAGHG